jgi:hypothetical protein
LPCRHATATFWPCQNSRNELLAVGLLVVIGVALAFLVGPAVADLPPPEPGRLLATWAAR